MYMQAEPHWSDDHAYSRFCREADLPTIPHREYLKITQVVDIFKIDVETVMDRLDVLIPPFGEGRVHPLSLINFVKHRERANIRSAKKDIEKELKLLLQSYTEAA